MANKSSLFSKLITLIYVLSVLLGFAYSLSKYMRDQEAIGVWEVILWKTYSTVVSTFSDKIPIEIQIGGLKVSLSDTQLAIGERANFFFHAVESGQLSLWNRSTSGKVH